jgi:hypothetical protein
MWVTRPFQPKDWATVRELHEAAGSSFEIPRRLEETIVVADEVTDKAVLIQGCRVTRESYVWVDHTWGTPALRWRVFKEAHDEVIRELERKDIKDIHVWIKGTKTGGDSSFAKRMMDELGWFAPEWKSYSLRIKE